VVPAGEALVAFMAEHFHQSVAHRINGRAKAMIQIHSASRASSNSVMGRNLEPLINRSTG